MKILKMLALIVIAVCGIMAQGFCADEKPPEEKITGSASVGVLNRYIFRGYEIGKSGLVIQPSLTASLKGFSATYWGNIDTNQRNTTTAAFANEGRKGFNETDLTLSYTHPFGKLSLTGGYTFYSLKYAEDTEEFFATIAYDMLTKPTLSIYQDVNAYPGTYMNLSFAHSFPVYKKVTLDLGASFSYFIGRGNFWKTYDQSTGDYTGSKYKGFHDGMVKAGFSIPATKAFVIQPIVQYYFPLSGDAKKTMGYDVAGNKIAFNHNGYVPYSLVAGINFTYNF
ncbi:MAG: hypothetical protein C0399_11205 [Syntrophus sp. (in: bacteria)]|nr:hypothetical protein [Syntrophus sp. (in: bacteria)]